MLGRASDASGLQNWLDALTNGAGRSEVVRGFSESAEFIRDTATDLVDWVRGQGVQDTIIAVDGSNVLMGGLLADQFIFDASLQGDHTVTDFETWDVLRLEQFTFPDFNSFIAQAQQVGADVVISNRQAVITLEDILVSDLTAANIEFGIMA